MTHAMEPSPTFGERPTPTSTWHWRFLDDAGVALEVESVGDPRFPAQSDAESWIGEVWRDLLDQGVDAVTLLDGEREVYGPMSLHPERS